MIEHKQVLKFIDEYRTNGFDHAIVFYKSPLGHFIDANERAAYIAGVEPSQLAGKKDAELRWSDFSEQYRSDDITTLQKDTSHLTIEGTLCSKLKTVQALTLKQPVKDTNGQHTGIFGASIHINEMSYEDLIEQLGFIQRAFQVENTLDTAGLRHAFPNQKMPEKLTSREIECCHYLCLGMTASEIAGHLHLSKRTVESHIGNAREKFQVRRKSELILKLFQEGIVNTERLLKTGGL